jgi:hypothetical protein
MKAIHKYNTAALRGNREAQRRIAQSQGWRPTIHDNPAMIALLKRGGIEIETHHSEEIINDTTFVTDNNQLKKLINPLLRRVYF